MKGESHAHRLLKHAALLWARRQGYRAAGLEIRLPNSPYRADVAACRLDRPGPHQREIGMTAVFECKQARPDFLHDSGRERASIERLAQLKRRRDKLERLVGAHYPTLWRGDSLFPEYDRSDPAAIGHEGYRRVIAEIRTLESTLFGRTKFDKLPRYRCADLFYLVIRPGILDPAEVPLDWGLLAPKSPDFDSDGDSPPPALTVLRLPRQVGITPARRLELLHRIATAATGQWMRDFDDGGTQSQTFPRDHSPEPRVSPESGVADRRSDPV